MYMGNTPNNETKHDNNNEYKYHYYYDDSKHTTRQDATNKTKHKINPDQCVCLRGC